jgi:hypothetical protein
MHAPLNTMPYRFVNTACSPTPCPGLQVSLLIVIYWLPVPFLYSTGSVNTARSSTPCTGLLLASLLTVLLCPPVSSYRHCKPPIFFHPMHANLNTVPYRFVNTACSATPCPGLLVSLLTSIYYASHDRALGSPCKLILEGNCQSEVLIFQFPLLGVTFTAEGPRRGHSVDNCFNGRTSERPFC